MKFCLKIRLINVILSSSLISSAFVLAPIAFANEGGGCHFHGKKPAEEAKVLECAEKRKAILISSGKIDKSWEPIKHDSITQIDVKEGKKEWKVSFKDPTAQDKSKETLYMFFSHPGNYLAVNFTGK